MPGRDCFCRIYRNDQGLRSQLDKFIRRGTLLKIISWNLLYRQGAAAADVAKLIEQEKPDLFLLQEAVEGINKLPGIVGGSFYTLPWKGKSYALGAWLARGEVKTASLELPFSKVPGKFPPRQAQILKFPKFSIVNVHLSHGQLLNRRQIRHIGKSVAGPVAIIGDFNAVGPIVVKGFKDVGPRRITHMAKKLMPFRLDRVLVRDLVWSGAKTLKRGPSDHRPIVIEINTDLENFS